MARFLTLSDANVSGKTVLVRADLNVPMADGQVSDGTRLDRLVPTLELLTQRGAKVAVLSHFGRPKGKVVPEMSLEPVAAALADVLGASVQFAPDCVGSEARANVVDLPLGEVEGRRVGVLGVDLVGGELLDVVLPLSRIEAPTHLSTPARHPLASLSPVPLLSLLLSPACLSSL